MFQDDTRSRSLTNTVDASIALLSVVHWLVAPLAAVALAVMAAGGRI